MTIEAINLTCRYGSLTALRDVTAAAAPGRLTVVIGPNAAGKSTLMRCLIGALKPSEGAAMIDGVPAHRLNTKRLAQRIAYVPQRSAIGAAFTARQVIELGRYALPVSRSRIDAPMAQMDLEDVAERPYQALSVGQQQRVTMARALAQLAPDGHLLLDEPVSAMDLRHVHQTMKVLREVARGGATVILAMHDLALAAAVADDAWLLRDGRLLAAGTVPDVLEINRLRSVFGVGFEWIARAAGPAVLLGGL